MGIKIPKKYTYSKKSRWNFEANKCDYYSVVGKENQKIQLPQEQRVL